jgi:ATP10 protein
MKIQVIIGLMALSLCAKAQKGKQFPEIIGVTLDEKVMSLPIKNGKRSVVAIVYNRAAEKDLKKWLNPLYDRFSKKAKSAGNFDMTESHDVNFIFVPMIAGIKMISDEFKATTDKAFWPVVMDTKKSDVKAGATVLGIEDRKIPYIFVLDKNGVIIDVQSGDYNEAKIDAMEEVME